MSQALASLTSQYTDSENEIDDHEENHSLINENTGNQLAIINDNLLVKRKYNQSLNDARVSSTNSSPANLFGSNTVESLKDNKSFASQISNEDEYEKDLDIIDDEDIDNRSISPISFHRNLLNENVDNIRIPKEPIGHCPKSLQEKIERLHEKMKVGVDLNSSIQNRKDFRNPSIYEKLIAYCGIDEFGTNFPNEIYDPHKWTSESFYEELGRKQKEEIEKRDKERRERTKVEFVTGTAKKPNTNDQQVTEVRKKTKWDIVSNDSTTNQTNKQAPLLTNTNINSTKTVNKTKPKVISAFGSIKSNK